MIALRFFVQVNRMGKQDIGLLARIFHRKPKSDRFANAFTGAGKDDDLAFIEKNDQSICFVSDNIVVKPIYYSGQKI